MDRPNRNGGGGMSGNNNNNNNHMRDYVDPWAHNGSNNQMGGGGNAFNNNNNNNGSMNGGVSLNMTSLMSSATGQNGNMFNGVGGDMDGKTTTQVTIPKDVRIQLIIDCCSKFN